MWDTGTCATATTDVTQQILINNEYFPASKKLKETENESLLEALESCKNQELGIEEASLIYGIPKRTLRAKLKNNHFCVVDEKYRVFVLPVFPPQAESDLVECLQEMIVSQVSFSPIEVRRLGYELVCEKYKISNLPKEKNCVLGQRWYKRFISKYPHLEVEHSQCRMHDEASVKFYNALENLVNKHGIEKNNIFAVDGVELKFRASSVDDLRVFHRRKTIYTDAKAICCTSPTGAFIPPLFLKPHSSNEGTGSDNSANFMNLDCSSSGYLVNVCEKLKEMCSSKMKQMPTSEELANIQKQIKLHLNKKHLPLTEDHEEELREKLYEQFSQLKNKILSKYESSLNEITHEIFHSWLSEFISYVKPNCHRKTLLLVSHQNYINYFKTLELAKSNGVVFLVLPPHSSHKIHPLDGFAMSLNRNLSTCARQWLGKNPDFKINQVPLQELFKKAYSETINPIIAKNGFIYSGIWPINRNIFESTELGGESALLQKNSQLVGDGLRAVEKIGIKSHTVSSSPIIPDESDLKKLCRICMKEKMYMKPLFESQSPNYHGKKIAELINVPVSSNDGLPAFICQYCLVQLMDTIKIRAIAKESHKNQLKLREALNTIYFEDGSDEKEYLYFLQCELNPQNQSKIINGLLSKNFDMNSICRICMTEKPLMTSIFHLSSQDCPDSCTKIMEVSQSQVHIHDGLSSSICPFCRASVNQAFEFLQKAQSSYKRFKELVAQIKSGTK